MAGPAPPNIGDIFSDAWDFAGDAVDWAGNAVSDAADVVTSIPIVGGFVKGMYDLSGVGIVLDIAQGKPIADSVLSGFKEAAAGAGTVAQYAAVVASFVPGVGTGVSAALSAGVALSQGKSITDALIAGVRGALPGGPIAAAAFDMAADLASGKDVAASALDAARKSVPGGVLGQKAFDLGVALIVGKKAQGGKPSTTTPEPAGQTRTAPYVIDKPGWRLDATHAQWCYDAADYCTPAVVGDRNSVTGEVYSGPPKAAPAPVYARPTSAALLSSSVFARPLVPTLVGRTATPAASSAPVPAPAPVTLKPAATAAAKPQALSVGAALSYVSVGLLIWRIAKMI